MKATFQIVGNYNFDPVQLQIIESECSSLSIRLTYWGQGEVVVDISIDEIDHTVLQLLENKQWPLILRFKSGLVHYRFKFKKTRRDGYLKGSILGAFFGFIPFYWWSCSTRESTFISFIKKIAVLK